MARIVIADDSPTLRRIVTSVLTKEGHEVVAGEDGIQAVQAVFREQPDAVVLDVQMPRVSGVRRARPPREAAAAMSTSSMVPASSGASKSLVR